MSDPVKNAEVEDVLSSIRRLVSEDKRPLQAAKPVPATDRLVLTPALRVEEDVAPAPTDPAPVDTAQEAVQSVLAEEDAVAEEVEEQAAAMEEPAQEDEAPQVVSDLSENYDDDPYNFDNDQDKDGETLDALILGAADAVPQDASDDAVSAVESVENEPVEIELAESEPEDVTPVESAPTPAETKAATLSAKIAALETAIGDISDEWEPDGASQDAYAGSEPETMVWEDDVAPEPETASPSVEAEIVDAAEVEEVEEVEESASEPEAPSDVAAPDQGDDDVTPDVAGFALGADDQLLDEDTLREMISEIVQSELQGALGERITRNVRRLVRREIHRALTARDLD